LSLGVMAISVGVGESLMGGRWVVIVVGVIAVSFNSLFFWGGAGHGFRVPGAVIGEWGSGCVCGGAGQPWSWLRGVH
jgi:hypothetical protein